VISPSQKPLPDNTQQSKQTSMPPVGFEITTSTGELAQIYALDRAATGKNVNMSLGSLNLFLDKFLVKIQRVQ
jgi:hypothetical protein